MVLLAKFLHLVGMALYLGGGLGAGVLNRAAGQAPEVTPLDRTQRSVARLGDWGAVLSFASGIYLIFGEGLRGPAFGKSGWLQLMITFGLLATAMSGIASGKLRRALKQPPEGGMARVRGTLATLRLIYLIAVVGAVVCGVWRFYW